MSVELVKQVRDDIRQQLKADRLVLPTLPEIALNIRHVAEDPDATIDDIINCLTRDPAMCARLLRVANSPLVRSPVPITDLNTAISRLGIDYTATLVVSLSMQQLFQATNDQIDQRMHECWSESVSVGAACQVLARHFSSLPPDQAMLAGLIHQIGKLPLLAYAENNGKLLQDGVSLDYVMDKLHTSLGSYILKTWGLPQDLVNVPKEYLDLKRHPDTADLTDLVQVTVIQSHADSEHPLASVNRAEVGAFQRLGLNAEEAGTMDEAMCEEIEATKAVFGSS